MNNNSLILSQGKVISLASAGIIPRGYVRVEEGYIKEVGTMEDLQYSGNERIFDLGGKTVLPGLIDSHCHLISENACPDSAPYIARSTIAGVRATHLALEGGLTSVRDVGCRHLGIYALRSAVMCGDIPGPRFQTAGRPIAGTGIMETWRSHSHDGTAEMLRGVRREWQAGANWVKISVSDGRWRGTKGWQDTPLITSSEIQVAVAEAHNKDMHVVCHVDGPVGAKLAVDACVNSIEHGVFIPNDLLSQMADHGIVYVPTVWIYSTQDLKVFRADLNFLNELHAGTIQRAHAAGVKISAGVDYCYKKCTPPDGLVNELSTLMKCGLNEMDVIQAATIRGADLLGWKDHIGSLAPGKLADLIVVDGDPLKDIESLRKVVLVLQGGQIVTNHIDNNGIPEPGALPDLLPSWMLGNTGSTASV